MYRIVHLTGPDKGKRVVVQHNPAVIGSSESCRVKLEKAPAIADEHAELTETAGNVVLRNLSLDHETLVDGDAVQEKVLDHGNEIQVGQIRLLYQRIQAQTGVRQRRLSRTQAVAFVTVGMLVIGQIIMLVGTSSWRRKVIEGTDIAEAPPVEIEAPEPEHTAPEIREETVVEPELPVPAEPAVERSVPQKPVEKVQSPVEAPPVEPVKPKVEKGERPQLEISGVNVERPGDDVVLVSISLVSRAKRRIFGKDVEIRIACFDRDESGGIVSSNLIVPENSVRLKGSITAGDERALTVSCLAADEQDASAFLGVRVSVYLKGELVHELASDEQLADKEGDSHACRVTRPSNRPHSAG